MGVMKTEHPHCQQATARQQPSSITAKKGGNNCWLLSLATRIEPKSIYSIEWNQTELNRTEVSSELNWSLEFLSWAAFRTRIKETKGGESHWPKAVKWHAGTHIHTETHSHMYILSASGHVRVEIELVAPHSGSKWSKYIPLMLNFKYIYFLCKVGLCS